MIGTELEGRYRIEAKLGEGGVGTVYRGVQLDRGLAVAVKVLRDELSSSPELRHRFEREARALTSLSHPNIVSVIDSGVSGTTAYLVMELLSGETLSERLKRGAMSAPEATHVMHELLVALAFVHSKGLVHRDVKPANIFLEGPSGGGASRGGAVRKPRVRLLDFGLAKFLAPPEGDKMLTRAGQVFGTPSYMAPEQIAGQEADCRVDVYAAGIVFFEMLAGRSPFRGDASEVLRKHIMEELPMDAIPKGVASPELAAFIRRAAGKTRAERFANAGEMLTALEGATEREALESTMDLVELGPENVVDADGATLLEAKDTGEPASSPEAAEPGPAGKMTRVVTTGAVAISLAALAAAAAGVYVFASPERAAERRKLETALGLRPGPDAMVRGPANVPSGAGHAAPPAATSGTLPPPDTHLPASPGTPPPAASGTGELAGTAAAPTTTAAPAAPAAPVPLVNPWTTSVPAELSRFVSRANRPKGFEKKETLQIHQYNAKHPSDPRGHLLLARSYVSRRWFKDALSEYAIAMKIDPASRADPRMLRDLILMVELGSGEASRTVADVYGASAIPAVDRALAGRLPNPQAPAQLERLRAELASGSQR